jgi:hypothetical protein
MVPVCAPKVQLATNVVDIVYASEVCRKIILASLSLRRTWRSDSSPVLRYFGHAYTQLGANRDRTMGQLGLQKAPPNLVNPSARFIKPPSVQQAPALMMRILADMHTRSHDLHASCQIAHLTVHATLAP